MSHVELFDGVIRANPWLLALNLLLIGHFIISYIKDCYLKGFKVDFWHSTTFLTIFIPAFIIYPFSASFYNIASTGKAIYAIQKNVDYAYLIIITGYFFLYVGYYYYNLTKKKTCLYKIVNTLNNSVALYIYNNLKSKVSITAYFIFGLVISLGFLSLAFIKYGVSFELRNHMLSDSTLKPFFNFVLSSYVPITMLFFGIRYLQFREGISALYFLIFAVISFFSGTRAVILGTFLSLSIFFVIAKKRKVSLLKLFSLGFLFLIVIVYLSNLRAGNASAIILSDSWLQLIYGLLGSFFGPLLYGNSFSDTRDFAWILSAWDGSMLLGKTYLAGLLSFIPRSLLEFRGTYALGVYTAEVVGFSPEEHAGLRPGIFGEAFLNFGLIGVIFLGFIGGYILRYVDAKLKDIVNRSEPMLFLKMYAFTFIYTLISNFYVTAGFWAFYVFLIILVMGYLVRQSLILFSK